MGFIPEAMCNYLLRLGWSHGDEEIISRQQAIAWFDLDHIGKSPARFDLDKLTALNAHYLRAYTPQEILPSLRTDLETALGGPLTAGDEGRLIQGMKSLQERSKDLKGLAQDAQIYCGSFKPVLDEKALAVITPAIHSLMPSCLEALQGAPSWDEASLEAALRQWTTQKGLKMGQIAQPLRALLTGKLVSPSVFEMMAILGPDLSKKRLKETLEELAKK
jgi:glutamyl-tRNA synthetase